MANRVGCQLPTASILIPYKTTKGEEAIGLYNRTGRTAQEWQTLLMNDILGETDDELWTHTKFGYSVPRRNGKSEILIMREIFGLMNGERILHTAHRTTTSHSTWERLCDALNKLGYKSQNECRKDDGTPDELIYDSYKAFGLESISLRREGGGKINFRTRTSKGGLGEGYDLLVIDEAQEYTDDQASSLKYVVTDSRNPQTLLCGTPPTNVSTGTVFAKMRENALFGDSKNTGWAEWSVESKTDPHNVNAWYQTNPSLGYVFTERSVEDEIGTDDIDFNIQRLGLWLKYNLKSAISENDWEVLKIPALPNLTSKLTVGIKFAHDGKSISMTIAAKTEHGQIFVEAIDNRPISAGYNWVLDFLQKADIQNVIIDGANGQAALADAMKRLKMKPPILTTAKEIIAAGASFEQGLYQKSICHLGQPSLTQSVTNCEKRSIGSSGGFGYKSIMEDVDVSLLESAVLAFWGANSAKEKKKQSISY